MKAGIDFSTITKGERRVMLIGAALFVNALIPYWYRVRTARETFLHNGGLFGWGLLAALAGFLAAVTILIRHSRTPAAFNDHAIHAVLGILAVVALAGHGAVTTKTIWIGYWIELALAGALGAAGLARLRERRRGWI